MSSASATESMRGSAAWKRRPGSTTPRPGVSLLTCDATARPYVLSKASLSLQLDASAEGRLHAHPDLHGLGRGQDDMDAVVEPPRRDVRHDVVEAVVLLAERPPAVDHEEDVAGFVLVHLAGRSGPTELLDARDPVAAEQLLAPVQPAEHVVDGASDPLGVGPRGHGSDVRDLGQTAERPAAEVQAVEDDVTRRVAQAERPDEGTEQHALARLWRAEHHHVACRPRRSPTRAGTAVAWRARRPGPARPGPWPADRVARCRRRRPAAAATAADPATPAGLSGHRARPAAHRPRRAPSAPWRRRRSRSGSPPSRPSPPPRPRAARPRRRAR